MNGRKIYQIRTGKEKIPKGRSTHPADCHTLFGMLLIVVVLGAIFGDRKFSDALLGAWALGWTLIGAYILFALKVANQWEKLHSK